MSPRARSFVGPLALLTFSVGCAWSDPYGPPIDPPPLPTADDDSAPSDDDSAAGDDDATSNDDDTSGDDDTSTTDDDTSNADDDTSGDDDLPQLPQEGRALWVTRWNWSDAADIEAVLDDAAGAGFNTVFFQVRGHGDAYYASTLEPWAQRLTGTLGGDPGWDPLAHAVAEAHARGLQLHPWLNTFPAWSGTTPPTESTPRHMLLAHPEWRMADSSGTPMPYQSGYVFVSPGIEAVREHVAAVAADIAARYDIDGLHLDYIRYPGVDFSHDALSEAEFDAYVAGGGTLSWAGWQRAMVVETALRVRQESQAVHPGLPITASVWGIYDDIWGWNTSEGRDDYHQDSLAMLDAGALDRIVPMIYWPITNPPGEPTDFATLVDFFIDEAGGDRVWVGMDTDYAFPEIAAEIDYAVSAGASGVSLFAWPTINDRGHWDDLAAGPFAAPAP